MDFGNLNLSNPTVLVPIIVVLVLGPIFLIAVGSAISLQMKVIASRRWAATPGHIISSEVASGWKYGGGRRKGHIIYFPKVVYEYQVGGQTYQGDRIMFGSFPPNRRPEEAQRKLTQYPLHSTGQVFYNPQNPSESVLERSSPQGKNALARRRSASAADPDGIWTGSAVR